MSSRRTLVCTSLALAVGLAAQEARADGWTLWAEGLPPGVGATITISDQGEMFYSILAPQMDGNGAVYRASLKDPTFTKMPTFPLPKPQMPGVSYNNVMTMTTTARGEPVVGLSINGNWVNTDPLIMTWDGDAGAWIAPPIAPPNEVCNRNLVQLARAPNGDLWATCQWHGAYHSSDDGRTFDYVDVSAAVQASVPSYFPTRANGAGDLGALFGLTIAPDGAVIVGSESGGVVYSTDDGATWRPLDWAPEDPMSSMARATNMGNVAGVGVLPDGRVVAEGGDGNGAYPLPGVLGLYVFDLAAHTTTTATGFPDYILAGLSVRQIVTADSGVMFLHSGQDRVDEMTGAPQFGGLARSSDGLTWVLDNDGIDEIFKVPNMELWVDGLGRGNARPFAVDGGDVYVATKTGKIFMQATGDGGTGTDTATTGAPATSTDATGGTGGMGGTGEATSTTPTSGPAGSSGAAETGDGASSGPTGEGSGEGCACDARGAPGNLALVGLVGLALRRRRIAGPRPSRA